MRCVWVIVVGVAALLLAELAPGAQGEARSRAGGEQVGVEFQFKADGFVLEFANDDGDERDRSVLTVRGHRQAVAYMVKGGVSEQGVEVGFGKLGDISVDFQPTKTLETWNVPRGCTGTGGKDLEGVFSGTIGFRGERGYVEAEATRVRGEMRIPPKVHCSRRPGAPRAGASRNGGEPREATLTARRNGRLAFAAVGQRAPGHPSHTWFVAARIDSYEGMLIYRYAYAAARASTFEFDADRGAAAVTPPWPFQGGARFRRGPSGHNSWTGSLKVQLLGSDPVDLVGPGFRALLKPEVPYDE
jgi:hypothetical protein